MDSPLIGPGGSPQAGRRRLPLALAAGAVLLAAAGGGAWALRRHADPSYRAEQLLRTGDTRAAAVELRNALRTSPRDPALHLRLGEVQMRLADPVAAEKEFRIARALGADRAGVVPQLADALLAQGLNEETLRQVPVSGPTPDSSAQFLYRRSIAQLSLNDTRAAEATLAAAQAAAPGNPATFLIAARLAAAHEDFAQAETQVDNVLRQDPAQIDALLMKEQIVAARNDHPAALDLAARAVASAPWSAMAHIRHATEALYAKEDDRAQQDVDTVLAVQPRFMEAVYLKGILLARKGRYQDASVALNQLDGVTGRFPPALYYKALIAADLGQAETADSLARRYNVLVPKDPDGVRLAARSDIAVHAPAHAVAVLQKAIAAGIEDADLHDLLGSAQANMGDIPAALSSFQHALQLAPDDPGILTHMALAQIQAGRSSEAASVLARTLEISPTQPLASEALVSAALARNDLPEAEKALDRLHGQVGDTQRVGLLTGFLDVKRNDLDGARQVFADTLKRFPNSLEAKLGYARVLVQQGNRQDGLRLMAEVLAKDPANVPALNAYLPLLMQERDSAHVIAVLEAAHAADPQQAGFTATLSDALLLAGDPKRAVEMLRAAPSDGPMPPLVLSALARAQAAAGQDGEAKASFHDVLRTQPDDLVDRTALIDLLLQSHEYGPAQAELREALQRAPRNNRFLSTLVQLETQVNGLDAGLKLADTLRADPAHLPFSTLLKGDALMRAGQANAAARAYLDEFKLDPSVPPLLRAAAALNAAGHADEASGRLQDWLAKSPNTPVVLDSLAKLDILAGRLNDAQRHLEALLAMTPNDKTALNNLAWVYAQAGDSRARATAQKAYLQGADADSADTLGWIMLREHDAAAALPLLRQAGSQRPADPAMQYHLAAALQANGQPREAAPILQAVLQAHPAFTERPQAEQLLASLGGPH